MVRKNNKLYTILIRLNSIKGLYKPKVLEEKQISKIKKLNHSNNFGIQKVISKKYVILVFHDSKFRNPKQKIVIKRNTKIIFPAVKFQEIKNAISASPGKKIHNYLTKNIKIKKDWASLLIGFN